MFLHDDLGDRYAVERELGHGVTATVYLARDLKHGGRLVAIKVLSPDFALAVSSERFLREIRTTALLSHPHIVPFIDSDQTSTGRPYYVMRYIDGETLRDRIARDGRFAIAEALRITRQAAGALGHAHRHGVIHRDIKPGNIMLEDGHTWVTDFGIARAMAGENNPTVTSTGVTIGTPAYMSPEQAAGVTDLDARSDIYSLGCVLFEMLAGKMPFDGPDVQSVMHKHIVEPLPLIREFCPEVPERVEQLLDIALAKKRENRFATAAEFAEALSLEGAGALTPTRTHPVPIERRRIKRWKPRAVVAAGATLFAGVAVIAVLALKRPTLNPTRYYVAPSWDYGEGVSATMNAGRLLQDALNEWKGIQITGASGSQTGAAGVLARDASAGWYIRGGVSRGSDSLKVRAALYATRGDSLVRERSVNLAPNLVGADSAFARLADQLLFDDTVWAANGGRAGTRSVAARRQFARGLEAVQSWALEAADSAFQRATDADAGYAQGHLWLAQLRFWQNAPSATWRSSAERAATDIATLSRRDQSLSRAVLLFGREDISQACGNWQTLTESRPSDFAGWYGLAICLKADRVVIRDSRSPSGWRFRSSYHRALKAYQRAFQLLPEIHRSLRSAGFETVRLLLLTTNILRPGHALPPDTTTFLAEATWLGDSLAVIPFPTKGNPPEIVRRARSLTLMHQRVAFREIATAWVAASPRSSAALEALASSLELSGEPAALDTLRRALTLEQDPAERRRLAMDAVWLQFKLSVPSDLSGIRAARKLADSILTEAKGSASSDLREMASLAALTGRANLAAALARDGYGDWEIAGPLARIGPAFLAYASLGGPEDSLRFYEHEVNAAIDNLLAAPDKFGARMAWLARPVALAFPQYRLKSIEKLGETGYRVLEAEAALARGDSSEVLRTLDSLRPIRARFAPADITFDALYPETTLFAVMGEPRQAIEWLDPTLNVLAATTPRIFMDPARSAALVRAIALRADLADALGDRPTAKRWAQVVTILWSNADPFLQPVLQRMKGLESDRRPSPR